MTVETLTNDESLVADGANLDFPFTFKVFEKDTIFVFEDDVLTTADVIVTLNLDQTNNPGGIASLDVAPVAGVIVRTTRILDILQLRKYIASGKFPSKSHERGLDDLTMIIQQLSTDIGNIPGPGPGGIHNGVVDTVPDGNPPVHVLELDPAEITLLQKMILKSGANNVEMSVGGANDVIFDIPVGSGSFSFRVAGATLFKINTATNEISMPNLRTVPTADDVLWLDLNNRTVMMGGLA